MGGVLLLSIYLYAGIGERIRYNYQYQNALSHYTLTVQEQELRRDIFYFFDNKDKDKGLPRKIAVTNRYFLGVKGTGLTNNQAISLLESVKVDSLRKRSRIASGYAKELQDNKQKIERSGLSVEEVINVLKTHGGARRYNIPPILDYFDELKKRGIPYSEGMEFIRKYDDYSIVALKNIVKNIDRLNKEGFK